MEFFRLLESSFPAIEQWLSKEDFTEFKNFEYKDLILYHLGLGRWIRNNLLLENQPLYKLFASSGVKDRDDMSMLCIQLFYLYAHT